MSPRLLALAWILLLTACASRPPPAADDDALAGELSSFLLEGKVAWRSETERGRANLSWEARPGAALLVLTGPFGTGAGVLETDADGARLSLGERESRAPSAGALLERELGIPLPVEQVEHWVLGTPAPGPARLLEVDASQRPVRLEQAGWTVRFADHRSVGGRALPFRLEMTRETMSVKLVVTRWTISEPLAALRSSSEGAGAAAKSLELP